MGKANLDTKKKAITDLSSSDAYILISFNGDKVNRHQFIGNVAYALTALRVLGEVEKDIHYPPQAPVASRK